MRNGEVWLVGAYIAPYSFAREGGHDPERSRKLLLHRHEIDRITGALAEKGLTLVPMRLYLRDGKAKVQIGLGRGKRTVDKRADIRKREHEREMERARRRVRGRPEILSGRGSRVGFETAGEPTRALLRIRGKARETSGGRE